MIWTFSVCTKRNMFIIKGIREQKQAKHAKMVSADTFVQIRLDPFHDIYSHSHIFIKIWSCYNHIMSILPCQSRCIQFKINAPQATVWVHQNIMWQFPIVCHLECFLLLDITVCNKHYCSYIFAISRYLPLHISWGQIPPNGMSPNFLISESYKFFFNWNCQECEKYSLGNF